MPAMPIHPPRTRWKLLAGIAAAAFGCVVAWQLTTRAMNRTGPPSNAIMVLAPYWYNGTWVFDDPAVGPRREPFVAGVPEMIDVLVKDIPDSRAGFRLLFSANPFPGHQKKLTWLRGDSGGNYYKLDDPPMEGWICPAMFRYYKTPPPALYVKAEPMRR
jgi:hypothetical protein